MLLSAKTYRSDMTDVKILLNQIVKKVSQIYLSVCPILEMNVEKKDGLGIPTLPIHSFNAFEAFENFLSDKQQKMIVVSKNSPPLYYIILVLLRLLIPICIIFKLSFTG